MFLAERAACTKALGWERMWHVKEFRALGDYQGFKKNFYCGKICINTTKGF